MNQYLRFGNLISIEAPDEAYHGHEAEVENSWCVSMIEKNGSSFVGVAPYSGASEDWVVLSPNGSSGRVKFGSTIALYSRSSRGYVSSGQGSRLGPLSVKTTDIEPNLGEWQQCEILKHGDPASKDEVRCGDSITLRFKDGFCLSWHLSAALGDVRLVQRMSAEEKWVLAAPTLTPKQVDDFQAAMRSPDNYGRILLTQGLSTQQIVTKLVGGIPKVGGAISALLGIVMPPEDNDIWEKIKGQVTTLVKDLILENNLDDFRDQLRGVKENFGEYLEADEYSEKAGWLVNVLADLNVFKQKFYKNERPERTLPYLLATGTLHIAALQEQYNFSEKLFPVKDAQPQKQKTRHLKELEEKITFYTGAVKKAKENILKLRESQITLTKRQKSQREGYESRTSQWWDFEDKYTGETKKWDIQYESNYSEIERKDRAIEKEVSEYKSGVLTKLDHELESFIEPMYAWRYMNPEVNELPVQTTRPLVFGPFGGGGGTSFYDNPAGEPITGIAMRCGKYVDGVELTYGPRTVGVEWHGGSGGGLMIERLNPGERIVRVSGRAGQYVDALYFHTNQGRQIGGGGGGGGEFSITLPEAGNPVLVRLTGRAGKYVDAIGFEWKYTRFE